MAFLLMFPCSFYSMSGQGSSWPCVLTLGPVPPYPVSLQRAPAAPEAPCVPQVAECVWAPHLGHAGALRLQEQRQLLA